MNSEIKNIFKELKSISKDFCKKTGEYDIYTNSKLYEIIIANYLGHEIIKGHTGSFDAEDHNGNPVEYKHYKESSSNHTWTFNDYSDATLEKLKNVTVYFVYIDDSEVTLSETIKWYYKVNGQDVAAYIKAKDNELQNDRRMINISPKQLEKNFCAKKIFCSPYNAEGFYEYYLNRISYAITMLERLTGTEHLLTSNKLWELFLAEKLNHKVNSKQGGKDGKHDAYIRNEKYEYKISKEHTWTFEDISDAVLKVMRNLDGIYVAKIDKKNFEVKKCFLIKVDETVDVLKVKRDEKERKRKQEGKKIKRHTASLSKNELKDYNLIIKEINF